jgi:hypothetical protein
MRVLREGLPRCSKAAAREAGELTEQLASIEDNEFKIGATFAEFRRYHVNTTKLLDLLSDLGVEKIDLRAVRDDDPVGLYARDRFLNAVMIRAVRYPDGSTHTHSAAKEGGMWRRGHADGGFDQAERSRWDRKLGLAR